MGIFNNPNQTQQPTNGNGKPRADAFLNISLDFGDSKPKLVGIPLYADRVFHAEIIEHVKDNPERAQALAERMVVTFNMADGSTSAPRDWSWLEEADDSEAA